MAICLFPIFEQNKRLALCDYNNKYGSTMEESSKLNGIQHRFISYFSMLWSIIKRGRNGCLDISSFVEDEALERSVDQRRSTLYHRRPVRHTNKGIHKGCRNMEERNHNEKEVAKRLGTNGNGTKEVEYKPLPSGLSNGTQNATRKFEELEVSIKMFKLDGTWASCSRLGCFPYIADCKGFLIPDLIWEGSQSTK
eukprot:XP_019081596.1 PREDICTED: uncharacterized protein LOC100259687 isoform X4 [Vitis vinifera]